MGNPTAPRTGNCPPLDPNRKKVADYEATGREPGYDGNPPEFRERRDFVYMNGVREPTLSPENINHSRLKWLKEHKRIEQRQFDAGERLAKDWELSLIQPMASSVLVGNGGSGGSGQLPNDAKKMAMYRHGAAVKHLGRMWPIVELVVHQNKSVEKASAMLHIHQKVGMGQLYAALHFLADHYGL